MIDKNDAEMICCLLSKKYIKKQILTYPQICQDEQRLLQNMSSSEPLFPFSK